MAMCYLCNNKYSIDELREHMETIHLNDNLYGKYECVSCFKSYNCFSTFKYHWLSTHGNHNNESVMHSSKVSDSCNDLKSTSVNSVTSNMTGNMTGTTRDIDKSLLGLQDVFVNRTMSLYDDPALTRKHVQTFVTLAKEVVQSSIVIIKQHLTKVTDAENSRNSTLQLLGGFNEMFGKFDTEKKRINFLLQKGYYVTPIKVAIDQSTQVKRSTDGKKVQKCHVLYFFLCETCLKSCLKFL